MRALRYLWGIFRRGSAFTASQSELKGWAFVCYCAHKEQAIRLARQMQEEAR